MNEFLELFGDISVANVVTFGSACGFAAMTYYRFKKYLISKHEIEKSRDDRLQEVITVVKELSDDRIKNTQMQETIAKQVQELKKIQQDSTERLEKIENENKERECNRLRDIILQNYRYYTDEKKNPTKVWTRMDHDNFSALISDYEKLNGNGFVHSVVIPAMETLKIIEMN